MEDVGWRMWDGGCGMEHVGWRMWDGGCGMEDVGWRMEDVGCTMQVSSSATPTPSLPQITRRQLSFRAPALVSRAKQ